MGKLTETERIAMDTKIRELQLAKQRMQNKPPLPDEKIAAIISKIKEMNLQSAYYAGNTDKGLVEALSKQLGKEKVSVLDMTGRWPVIILDEDEFPPGYEEDNRPDWMKGVTAYFEGSPMFIDLMIEERPVTGLRENRWIRVKKWHPIKTYAFIGPARDVQRVPGFTWSESGGVLFATPN
jgi:hypothetical protein